MRYLSVATFLIAVSLWAPPLPAETTAETAAGEVPALSSDSDKLVLDDRLVFQYVRVNLAVDPFIVATDIQIEVQDGVVTLRGTVTCVEEVEMAEKVVAGTRGVKKVRNMLSSSGVNCFKDYLDLIRGRNGGG